MGTILIDSEQEVVTDVNGWQFRVLKVFYDGSEGPERFATATITEADLEEPEVVLRAAGKLFLIPLAKELVRKILVFWKENARAKHAFDCYDFACLISGVEQHDKKYLFKYWRKRPWLSPRQRGEVFFLIDRKDYFFRHAAIYLGNDLFISVYGLDGALEVSSLRDMKRDFGAKNVMRMNPRPRP